MADAGVDSECLKFVCDERGGHGDDFDREREGAEVRDYFAGVGNDNEFFRGAGYDLFAEECAAAAFDEGEAGGDFVGSVDSDIDLGTGIEVGDGDGEGGGEVFACLEDAMPRIFRPCFTFSPRS